MRGTRGAQNPAASGGTARSPRQASIRCNVPYYNQSLDFTCGPASLLMAMKSLDPKSDFSRSHEMQLWREATTIFMGRGHGGCSVMALGLAAIRRGFKAEIWINHRGTFLADRLSTADQLKVMRLLQKADLAELRRLRAPVHYGRLTQDDLAEALSAGALPIVLVDCKYIHGDATPHWVVVTGIDADHVYINDPWISREKGMTRRTMTNFAVPRRNFDDMATYGKKKERAAVLLRAR